LRVAPLRCRSVQRLPILPVSRQLGDRADYHPPHGNADRIAGPPQIIETSMGAFECMRAVVLNHHQRGAPSVDVVHMKYGAMPRAAVGRPSLSAGGTRGRAYAEVSLGSTAAGAKLRDKVGLREAKLIGICQLAAARAPLRLPAEALRCGLVQALAFDRAAAPRSPARFCDRPPTRPGRALRAIRQRVGLARVCRAKIGVGGNPIKPPLRQLRFASTASTASSSNIAGLAALSPSLTL
jgi:hypothetical protein